MDHNNQFLEDAQKMGRMELKRPTLPTCIDKNGKKKKREVEHLNKWLGFFRNCNASETIIIKAKEFLNSFTPGASRQECIFGHFGDFQPGYEPN